MDPQGVCWVGLQMTLTMLWWSSFLIIDALHKLLSHVSIWCLTMKIGQWVCENFCSYHRKDDLSLPLWKFQFSFILVLKTSEVPTCFEFLVIHCEVAIDIFLEPCNNAWLYCFPGLWNEGHGLSQCFTTWCVCFFDFRVFVIKFRMLNRRGNSQGWARSV